MSVSPWPGTLALISLVCWAVGSLFFAAAGTVLLARTVRRGRTALTAPAAATPADQSAPPLEGAAELEEKLELGMSGRPAAEWPRAEAHEPSHSWTVESARRGNWSSWGTTYDDRDWAAERYEEAVRHYSARPYRLVHATTTYTVEAEHQPDTEQQDAPPADPHPTEADLKHVLAAVARVRAEDAAEQPASSGTEGTGDR
ncbi:hypothetical protein ACFW91_25075 [Streptomyces asoensis]|uniref:hypothetical protein n=1 Tax=Streptomyces asoensis TaxID=249586 RepID=UPI0036C801AA